MQTLAVPMTDGVTDAPATLHTPSKHRTVLTMHVTDILDPDHKIQETEDPFTDVKFRPPPPQASGGPDMTTLNNKTPSMSPVEFHMVHGLTWANLHAASPGPSYSPMRPNKASRSLLRLLCYVVAFISGALEPFQFGFATQLSQLLGMTALAALACVGPAALLLLLCWLASLCVCNTHAFTIQRRPSVDWWTVLRSPHLFIAGVLLSLCFPLAMYATGAAGFSTYAIGTLLGQLGISSVWDQFGLMGYERKRMETVHKLGLLLVLLGVILLLLGEASGAPASKRVGWMVLCLCLGVLTPLLGQAQVKLATAMHKDALMSLILTTFVASVGLAVVSGINYDSSGNGRHSTNLLNFNYGEAQLIPLEPFIAWLGGLLYTLRILTALWMTPKLGIPAFFTYSSLGLLLSALLNDVFGTFESERSAALLTIVAILVSCLGLWLRINGTLDNSTGQIFASNKVRQQHLIRKRKRHNQKYHISITYQANECPEGEDPSAYAGVEAPWGSTCLIELHGPDAPGILAGTTGVLSDFGIDLEAADVSTTKQGMVHNKYVVSRDGQAIPQDEHFRLAQELVKACLAPRQRILNASNQSNTSNASGDMKWDAPDQGASLGAHLDAEPVQEHPPLSVAGEDPSLKPAATRESSPRKRVASVAPSSDGSQGTPGMRGLDGSAQSTYSVSNSQKTRELGASKGRFQTALETEHTEPDTSPSPNNLDSVSPSPVKVRMATSSNINHAAAWADGQSAGSAFETEPPFPHDSKAKIISLPMSLRTQSRFAYSMPTMTQYDPHDDDNEEHHEVPSITSSIDSLPTHLPDESDELITKRSRRNGISRRGKKKSKSISEGEKNRSTSKSGAVIKSLLPADRSLTM